MNLNKIIGKLTKGKWTIEQIMAQKEIDMIAAKVLEAVDRTDKTLRVSDRIRKLKGAIK